MSRHATKAAGNIYCQARYHAAETNEKLGSREGAAEQLFCGRDVIAKVELDIVRPDPELVAMMADLYNAPELLNILKGINGKTDRLIEIVEELPVTQITLKILNILKGINGKTDRLIEIVEDGVIDESEQTDIAIIIKTLEDLARMKEELKVHVERSGHEQIRK